MRCRLILMIVIAVLLAAATWWSCVHGGSVAFLPANPGAEWIVQPNPPNTWAVRATSLTATFKRSAVLDAPPADSSLTIRAFRNAGITINGQPAAIFPSGKSWKEPAFVPIAELLRPGTNEIAVCVTNDNGPPALWLRLQAGQTSLGSDTNWLVSITGTEWRPARYATQPPVIQPADPIYGGERMGDSLRRVWPEFIVLGVLSLVLACGLIYWLWPPGQPPDGAGKGSRKAIYTLFLLVALARIALLANNIRQIPAPVGFDAAEHEQYVAYVEKNHAFPLPNESWEAQQPPLYYFCSATLLDLCGLSLSDTGAENVLRTMNGVIGIMNCWLVLLCLRRLFPLSPPAQAAGLLVAVFVPPGLYLSEYITNEPLAGLFTTAAFYCYLRVLPAEKDRLWFYCFIGAALGAALLTKFSTLLVAALIPAALGLRLLAKRNYSPRDWLGSAGLVVLVCLVVCGWHYERIWAHFGRPVVWNWDKEAGFSYWQYPGFRTSSYYFRFGQVLISPLFSAFQSFGDGLYSTLWGDGLLSGMPEMGFQPPWNYDWMNAAYLLALGTSLLFLAGFFAKLANFVRHPSPEWFVSLGAILLYGWALLHMSLSLPSYAQAKASYGFPALVAFSAFVGAGWNCLARRSLPTQIAAGTLLLTWTASTFSAFWVCPDNFEAYRLRALAETERGQYPNAVSDLAVALKLRPGDPVTHFLCATISGRQDNAAAAISHYDEALRNQPDFPDALNNLAWILATSSDGRLRDGDRATLLARRACELTGYRLPAMITTLAAACAEAGQFDEAVSMGRKASARAAELGDPGFAQKNLELVALYQTGRPFHQAPRTSDPGPTD